ncbi:MAG: sortase [Ruminococcus sp.]|nr:sortase [Ruminococcus sp.]
MNSNTGRIFILLGVLLLLAAAALCKYNTDQNKKAEQYTETVIEKLKEEIPAEPPTEPPTGPGTENDGKTDDLFAEYTPEEETAAAAEDKMVLGEAYCGYITLPSLGLELPVMSSWSYPNLRLSPCRYSGSADTNDMIIAAHNYSSHFGRIGELATGDEIVFTDTLGRKFCYTLSYMELIEGRNVDQMFSGRSDDWDLTLFTCTLSGQSRVTVRAVLKEEDDE